MRRRDYDGSGVLDELDANLLATVTERARFCPAGKTCDVNSDGVVDIQDLGMFNAKLLEHAMQQQASRSLLSGNGIGGDAPSEFGAGEAFWSAATGVAVE